MFNKLFKSKLCTLKQVICAHTILVSGMTKALANVPISELTRLDNLNLNKISAYFYSEFFWAYGLLRKYFDKLNFWKKKTKKVENHRLFYANRLFQISTVGTFFNTKKYWRLSSILYKCRSKTQIRFMKNVTNYFASFKYLPIFFTATSSNVYYSTTIKLRLLWSPESQSEWRITSANTKTWVV